MLAALDETISGVKTQDQASASPFHGFPSGERPAEDDPSETKGKPS